MNDEQELRRAMRWMHIGVALTAIGIALILISQLHT